MSRRSRSRYRRAGEARYSSSAAMALPRTHEGVRRYSPWAMSAPSLAQAQGVWRRLARPTLFPVPLAKPAVGRLSSGRYSPLSVLRMRVPTRVRFCVQRRTRREVIFALGVGGSRGSAGGRHGTYRRNGNSAFRC